MSADAVSEGTDAQEATPAPEQPQAEPMLRVLRGQPTDAELAALVLVVAAASSSPEPEPELRSLWNDPALLLRSSAMPSSSAWTSPVRAR
ncbi:acyl-CoA carboxylase epsilon subunit [Rhodococcus sp. X156]|uniref:acyl-CoA carboxylase epsilon subunit n=1 Tax=Rhodococcus sp. X156 TaxID=2499145 RepID=UPI001F4946C3|nr:acyl-CoA carboxylase epsilon subunit [Rhodococcus sp. X156]